MFCSWYMVCLVINFLVFLASRFGLILCIYLRAFLINDDE